MGASGCCCSYSYDTCDYLFPADAEVFNKRPYVWLCKRIGVGINKIVSGV